MITLKDLSEYDIKNINVSDLSGKLFQRKDILLNLVIIVVVLIGIGRIYTSRSAASNAIQAQIIDLKKKNLAVSDYKMAQAKVSKHVQSLPKGLSEADSVVDKINEFAILRNIQISSIAPQGAVETDYYDIIHVSLKVASDDFTNIGLFVADIENSGLNLRIDQFDSSVQAKRGYQNTGEDESLVSADIKISAVSFKEKK